MHHSDAGPVARAFAAHQPAGGWVQAGRVEQEDTGQAAGASLEDAETASASAGGSGSEGSTSHGSCKSRGKSRGGSSCGSTHSSHSGSNSSSSGTASNSKRSSKSARNSDHNSSKGRSASATAKVGSTGDNSMENDDDSEKLQHLAVEHEHLKRRLIESEAEVSPSCLHFTISLELLPAFLFLPLSYTYPTFLCATVQLVERGVCVVVYGCEVRVHDTHAHIVMMQLLLTCVCVLFSSVFVFASVFVCAESKSQINLNQKIYEEFHHIVSIVIAKETNNVIVG